MFFLFSNCIINSDSISVIDKATGSGDKQIIKITLLNGNEKKEEYPSKELRDQRFDEILKELNGN